MKGNSPQSRLRRDFFQQSAKWNGMLFGRTGLRCMEQPGRTSMQRIPETIRSNSGQNIPMLRLCETHRICLNCACGKSAPLFAFPRRGEPHHLKQTPQPVAQFGKQRCRVMNMAFRNPSETLYPKKSPDKLFRPSPERQRPALSIKKTVCRIAGYEASDDCAAGIPCPPAKYTVPIHSGTA